MTSAYATALLDYPRRVRFPVTLVLSVLALLPAIKGYVEKTEWAGEYGLLVGALVLATWVGLLSGHLKEVLARPQGRLLPCYGRVQVTVALMLLSPAFLVCLACATLAGFRVPAAFALSAALCCLYWSWPYLFDRGNLLLFFGPASLWWFSALANSGRFREGSQWLERTWPLPVWWILVSVLCLAIFALVTRRMLHLSESNFEYHRDPSMGWRSGTSPDSDMPFIGFFRRAMPWFGHYRIVPGPSLHGASTPRRVSHWRRGMGPRSPMVTGLAMAGIVALMGLYFVLQEEASRLAELAVLLIYLWIFPLGRFSYTLRRRVRLETETLFPATRERFVWEMGIATAVDILMTWLFLVLGTLIARAAGLFTSIAWSSFPYLLALSLGVTILGIGLAPWYLRLNGDKWPSLFLSMTVTLVGGLVALFLRQVAGFGTPGIWLVCVGVLAGLGVLGAWHGYRFWCRLELGRGEF